MDLQVVNALLNGATIVTFVAYFWFQNQKGNIITRRENTMSLGLKDEVIRLLQESNDDKDETIREQARQLTEALEFHRTFRAFVEAVKQKAVDGGGGP